MCCCDSCQTWSLHCYWSHTSSTTDLKLSKNHSKMHFCHEILKKVSKISKNFSLNVIFQKSPCFRSSESSFQFHDKNTLKCQVSRSQQRQSRQQQHLAEAMTMQDKHRPCQDGMFSDTTSKRKTMHPLSRAQRWMKHEGTNVHSTHATSLKADCEFSCLQEISRHSRSVLNCLARQKQTRDSRGNIIKTRSDIQH